MPRIFIALPIDPAVRKAITGIIPAERGAVRWVKEHQYHITLRFLGDISEEQLRRTKEAVDQVGKAWTTPLHLVAQGVGAFPGMQRARVIWVGLAGDTEPLLQLQRRLEQALSDLGFPTERRRFTPHVTIGRLREPASVPDFLLAQERSEFGAWTVSAIQVIESKLYPTGPVYTVRHEVTLPNPRDGAGSD